MGCCGDLHSRCGGMLAQPVEKLLGGGCGADGAGLSGSWLFSDQSRLFNHLRACVSIVADFLCTIFPLLSPVCVDPPVRRLWKTSPEPRLAQLPEACSRIDQLSRQDTDPQPLFPSGAGYGKLSTMPVGRTAQKVWTTCPQIAAGHGRRALAFAVRFVINRRKCRRYGPAAKFAKGFPHRLCSVLPARCGRVVDGSLRAAAVWARAGLINICPGAGGPLPILESPWGREIQHVQLLGGTDPHRGPGRPR
jgi:hypothetical protein